MCGIIGMAGRENVFPRLLKGLKNLEYRGYDSSGIAGISGNKIIRFRQRGRISALEQELLRVRPQGLTGIGHTRWATHGGPTEENAHPHFSANGKFALVHNGIIENAEELKSSFLERKVRLSSQTDSEIAVQLIELFYKGDIISAISEACRELRGSFAFGILCEDAPDTVFAVGKSSPLMAVKCKSGCCIASDICAVEEEPVEAFRLSDGEICALTEDNIRFFNPSGKPIEKYPEKAEYLCSFFDKGEYEHFMLKEIYEQPQAVRNTIESFLKGNEIVFSGLHLYDSFIREGLKRIVLVGCGSAYYAGLTGKTVIERLGRIPCSVEIASEFRYSQCFCDEATLAVFISQSGETADTLAALRLAKKKGAKTLSVVNVRGSAIAEESESVIFTEAGREFAVATTKAYSSQLAVLYGLAIYFGRIRGEADEEKYVSFIKGLSELPEKIEKTIDFVDDKMKALSAEIYNDKSMFYIGRQADFATACEGALKMKEISYINAQSYPAGELKHGAISLIEEGTTVIAVAGRGGVYSKTASNISEVRARGARVILITDEMEKECSAYAECTVKVPEAQSELQSSLFVIPLQLLGYYCARLLGCDIDKPKNLAKSVTVE